MDRPGVTVENGTVFKPAFLKQQATRCMEGRHPGFASFPTFLAWLAYLWESAPR